MKPSVRRCLACLVFAVPALFLSRPRPALANGPLLPHDVFHALATKKTEEAREGYLKAKAGREVRGWGYLEALTPRSPFDTSVPDPMVAVLVIGQRRRAECGLPRSVMDALGWLRGGSPVAFEGRLVDAQGWDGAATLYLTRCTLSRP